MDKLIVPNLKRTQHSQAILFPNNETAFDLKIAVFSVDVNMGEPLTAAREPA